MAKGKPIVSCAGDSTLARCHDLPSAENQAAALSPFAELPVQHVGLRGSVAPVRTHRPRKRVSPQNSAWPNMAAGSDSRLQLTPSAENQIAGWSQPVSPTATMPSGPAATAAIVAPLKVLGAARPCQACPSADVQIATGCGLGMMA